MIRREHIVKRLEGAAAHTQRAFKLISFSPKSTGHALEDDIIQWADEGLKMVQAIF